MKKALMLLLCFLIVITGLPVSASLAQPSTFTLMIYLCGSDLETDRGSASDDIIEMAESGIPLDGPVTVLVETGGAYEWWLEGIDPDCNERWVVGDGDLYYLEDTPRSCMGSADTLSDFILFGMETAPADRYGLILWDHGSGSTMGVCFDEFTDEYLTVEDIHDALATVREADSGFNLDFIAFDACLMANFEMANYVRDYAEYMIASQELAPAYGFDYETLVRALVDDPAIDMPSFGKIVADSYIRTNLQLDPDDYMTLSVLDLSAMDALTSEMERIAQGLTDVMEAGQYATISRSRHNMRSLGDFGGSSSDMVDLGHFIDVYGDVSGADTRALRQALDDVVIYNHYTRDNLDFISGLSILVPFDTREDFPDYIHYYDPLDLYPRYTSFVTGYTEMLNGGSYVFTPDTPRTTNAWTMVSSLGDNVSFSGSGAGLSSMIDTEVTEDAPAADGDASFGEDGVLTYSLSLTDEDMRHLSYVEGNLMIDISDDEMEAYVDLGYLQNTLIDWDNNTVYSLFDGTWPVMEGQVVYMIDQIVTARTRRSLINAWVNDQDVYLLVVFDEERPGGEIIGYTEGYNENGTPLRGYEKLQPGDIIIPQYYLYAYIDGQTHIEPFDGDPIEYTGAPLSFGYEDISGEDTDFAYTFCLNDIFGEYTFTDFLFFTL